MHIDPSFRQPGVVVTVAVLVGAAGISMLSLSRERDQVKALEADRAQLLAESAQTRSQLRDLSTRFDTLSAAVASQPAPAPVVTGRKRPSRPQPVRSRPVDDRVSKLQSQVSMQQKELARTRQEIVKTQQNLQGELNTTREGLQGELNSTRDNLNGSIARNHSELAVLQKRGERNFYEFDLTRTKEMKKVGPLSLALRKSNTKHKNYNVDMLVEDNRLEKKNINLYEPVLITLTDRPQPVEVVVNFIGKDQIKGYVSEPRYRRSELAENAPAPVSRPTQLSTR